MLYTFLLALTPLLARQVWYGPARVSFDLQVSGSPYDAVANDVRVRFTSGSKSEERLAYFDGRDWNAVLLTTSPGRYRATVYANGSKVKALGDPVNVDRVSTTSFVKVDDTKRSFILSNGTPYWPLGHDLGWQDAANPPIPVQLGQMGDEGMNWSRIWACAWDGKNPYWPQDNHKLADYDMDQDAFKKWDAIVAAADKAGIRFQWVVFHHGEFSSEVDPNWGQNPWNVANGGFLKDPKEFFTDSGAIRRAKNLLRYLVARYGHEPSVLAWELFNEVENTNAARSGDWKEIGEWHAQMAEYLRTIDPYHHLITSSSELCQELTDPLDYYQPHGYPASVAAMLLAAPVLTDKPFFFGEVGLGGGRPSADQQRQTVRDAIWSALLAGHSGSAEFWYWDVVYRDKLGIEYANASKIIGEMRIAPGPGIRQSGARVVSSLGGDLNLAPGLSWEASKKSSFKLPEEGNAAAMGKLSSFLQGTNHTDMGSSFSFQFDAPADGKFSMALGTVSRNGANVVLSLDGQEALRKSWPLGEKDTPIDQRIEIPYSKGPHRLVVSNVGPDWVTVSTYGFSGMGSEASGAVSEWKGAYLGRVHRNAAGPVSFRLAGLSLPDGTATLKTWDLDSMEVHVERFAVKGGEIGETIRLVGRDGVFLLVR